MAPRLPHSTTSPEVREPAELDWRGKYIQPLQPFPITYNSAKKKKDHQIFGHLFAEKPLEKRRFGSLRHFGAPPPVSYYIQISKNEGQIFGHLFAGKPLEKRRFSSLRHFGAPPP